ncbi:MAG: hypothetical protein ACN6PI_04940 [Sphingobacterium siyangense]
MQSAEHQLTVDLSKRITPDIWLDVLIYFEHNLEQSSAAALYDALFEKGTDFAANVYLNEEDYTFFIDKIRTILERYATINPHAWVELGLQHILCRRHVVEKEKASLYLKRGIDAGVEWARPLYLYYNYLGLLADIDRDIAKAELDALALGGDLWGIAYAAHIDVWTDKYEEVFDRIQLLKQSLERKILRHYYEALQFYYARKEDKSKRLETLEEGITMAESRYCRFVLNEIKRAEAASIGEQELLVPEYRELFEYGMMDAAVQIALIKLQALGNNRISKNRCGISRKHTTIIIIMRVIVSPVCISIRRLCRTSKRDYLYCVCSTRKTGMWKLRLNSLKFSSKVGSSQGMKN